jgi:iron complex transport system ATP-binding protein
MSALQIQQLGLTMAGRQLIKPFDLSLETGQCWAVLGLNGSGKTSLLHTLAGLRPIDMGQVTVDGEALGDMPPRLRARRISLLFQQHQEQFPCTVMESVLIGRHPHLPALQMESESDRQLAQDVMKQVGLHGFAERDVRSLSGGEHQRMALARLLLQDTPIRLLDEPSNHLDIQHQIALLSLLKKQNREQRLTIMALHDINLALRFCDHVLMLMPGGQVVAGPSASLLNAENASRLYQHPMQLMEQNGIQLFYAAPTQE